MKKSRTTYDVEYKQQVVSEYLSGSISAQALADREGLDRGQIYKWRVQLDQRARHERIEAIAGDEGVSFEQARRIRELALCALRQAIQTRHPPPGCIHHSDRGVQYLSKDYVTLLNTHGLAISERLFPANSGRNVT